MFKKLTYIGIFPILFLIFGQIGYSGHNKKLLNDDDVLTQSSNLSISSSDLSTSISSELNTRTPPPKRREIPNQEDKKDRIPLSPPATYKPLLVKDDEISSLLSKLSKLSDIAYDLEQSRKSPLILQKKLKNMPSLTEKEKTIFSKETYSNFNKVIRMIANHNVTINDPFFFADGAFNAAYLGDYNRASQFLKILHKAFTNPLKKHACDYFSEAFLFLIPPSMKKKVSKNFARSFYPLALEYKKSNDLNKLENKTFSFIEEKIGFQAQIDMKLQFWKNKILEKHGKNFN